MTQIYIEPTCRYDHGPLKLIDRLYARKVGFGLTVMPDDIGDDLVIFGSFNLFTCMKCGYSEMFDRTPQDTPLDTPAKSGAWGDANCGETTDQSSAVAL